MKKKLRPWLLILLVSLIPQAVFAQSSVWKVSKGKNQLYIGGTIHALSQSDYPLPREFVEAYSRSKIIVFETDLGKMQDPEFQKEIIREVTYSDGRNLKMDLNESTYRSLEKHLSDRGVPIEHLVNFKPGMVAVTLSAVEIQRLGMTNTGVDLFFHNKALQDRKPIGELETVYEQLKFLSSMGAENADELISHTLRDIKELPEMINIIKDAWRNGDIRKLEDNILGQFKSDSPELYTDLVVKRNNAWIPKIEAMLKTKDEEYILVGALHLVGDDGLLKQLANAGYLVQIFR